MAKSRAHNDDKISGKELAELKRENGQLKRKVAKLQKQLQKALEGLFKDLDEPTDVVAKEIKKELGCPSCGAAGLKRLTTPTGAIVSCPGCHWRKFEVDSSKEKSDG